MIYGKLIDGEIIPAPNPLTVGNRRVYNPTREQYAAHGWMPIVDTPMPDTPENDDKYYTYHREVVDGKIVRVWEETTPPDPAPPPEPTPEERLEAQVLYTALMTDTLLEVKA